MTTQHDKAKRWQFGLKRLLVFTGITPVVIGIASGAAQSMSFAVAVMLFSVGFVLILIGFVLLLTNGLMFLTGNSDGFLAWAPERDAKD